MRELACPHDTRVSRRRDVDIEGIIRALILGPKKGASEVAPGPESNVRFSASVCDWIGTLPICARMAARCSVEAVAACCRRRGTPALRRLAGKSCASNALPANVAELRNISRRVLCFSKNFGLIFVRLSNVDYSSSSPTLVAVYISSIHTFFTLRDYFPVLSFVALPRTLARFRLYRYRGNGDICRKRVNLVNPCS
jgi:hypothetical protein